jgi:hypothetical protein
MEGLLFLALIAFGAWRFWGKRHLQVSRAMNALSSIPGFAASHAIVGTDGSALAVDPSLKKVAFIDRGGFSVYAFRDLLSVEVAQNGHSVTRTKRGSQLVGAAIGHLLFGKEGFIVGGSTGSSRTTDYIETLSLKVYINDVDTPMREIQFYHGRGKPAGNATISRAADALNEWYGRLRVAIASP